VVALKSELMQVKASLSKLLEETRQFREAVRLFSQKIKQFFAELVREKEQNKIDSRKSSWNRNRDVS